MRERDQKKGGIEEKSKESVNGQSGVAGEVQDGGWIKGWVKLKGTKD